MLFFFSLLKTLHLSLSLFSVHALSTLRGIFSRYCKPRPWVLPCPSSLSMYYAYIVLFFSVSQATLWHVSLILKCSFSYRILFFHSQLRYTGSGTIPRLLFLNYALCMLFRFRVLFCLHHVIARIHAPVPELCTAHAISYHHYPNLCTFLSMIGVMHA